ncbi:DEAD/DEAH box helicase [Nocardia sp. XZ_19_385]|uniref:DEAD/DEAH box helicase n=1 Tax=Nocardia sp. XZ_19_385 TaxID=2769488 RepID=UPI00188F608B|nr:ATP-binding protein [Nocardia sp. XZ_19_385]
MDGDLERQARILRYWRAVEYFSPPKVDAVAPSKGIRAAWVGRPLPWEPGSGLSAPRRDYVWRHTVYAGVFEISKVRDVLQDALRSPEAERDFDGRNGGQSAIVSLTVDHTGRLLKESVTLSSCAWAVGRTVVPGPSSDDWLDGFDEDAKDLLGFLFEIGDGKVSVVSEPTNPPADNRPSVLGAIAGMMARVVGDVALDAATGGIASGAAIAARALGSVVGPVAGALIEKAGGRLAEQAIDKAVDTVAGGRSAEAGSAADSDTEEPPAETDDQTDQPPTRLGEKALALEDLVAITRWLAEALVVDAALSPDTIRIKSYQVWSKSADEVKGEEFLNSFYADDLEHVAEAISAGQVGAALTEYLSAEESIDTVRRIDVRQAPHEVLRSLSPVSMPLGRWPANPAHPLTLSQQFAVNEIMNRLGDKTACGIFAVNGPPGTGKTTMLRDLIAALVVERAARLAKLDSARDAFEKFPASWRTEQEPNGRAAYPQKIYPLIGDLTGFEIVAASSNNGAVENITLEVPNANAVDLEAFPDAEYLTEQASMLTDDPAWGAIAARLGRRSYRSEFVERFWWGEGESEGAGLHEYLKSLTAPDADENLARPSWSDAVVAFNDAVADAEHLADQRRRIADILQRDRDDDATLSDLRRRVVDGQGLVAQLQDHHNHLTSIAARADLVRRQAARPELAARTALRNADGRVERTAERVQVAESAVATHDLARPGRLRRLIGSADRDWMLERTRLMEVCMAADEQMRHAEQKQSEHQAQLHARQRELSEAGQKARHAQARVVTCQQALEKATAALESAGRSVAARRFAIQREIGDLAAARERWPGNVPGAEWHQDSREAMELREKSAPWMDEEFAEARSRVFLAALDLHHAVLVDDPELTRKSLLGAMKIVKGDAPNDLPEDTVLAAWQLLFFVVPVVSTTFASAARMFSRLGSEALGWLFIDEAGQAAPHEAVGALWRSKRAVVVGDPRQLEPVVALPWSGQKRLARQFEVDPRWAPQGISVQSVADRLNVFGTWLPDAAGEDQTWVGSPLRVHRRCDRLMFDVSNEIAYDNLMVYGVPSRDDGFDLLAGNTWLDVKALSTGEKWNPIEGRYVLATLNLVRQRVRAAMERELDDLFDDPPVWAENGKTRAEELQRRVAEAVFVVSPFREVVQGLEKTIGRRFPIQPKRVGTVHTTQGKEADIVILVLGTTTGQRGSRDWAAQSPNLLNVALTRARRRLVVVGDYQNWKQHKNFRVLADQVDNGALAVVDVAITWPLRGHEDQVDWRSYASG